jgi:hypothetical protein
MRTPLIARLDVTVGTDASASTTMQSPGVEIGQRAVATTYEAVADPDTPQIGVGITVPKYSAEGELPGVISFTPRSRTLESDGITGVTIESNRNDQDGDES